MVEGVSHGAHLGLLPPLKLAYAGFILSPLIPTLAKHGET